MTRLEALNYFRENWPTNKGAWFPGEKILYRDKSLLEDFVDKSWMTLLMYGITGKMPSVSEALIIEKFWAMNTSFPDPRLWNNRVATLAGTTRSTATLAISAATAISEAKVYGPKPLYLGSLFLHEAKKLCDDTVLFEKYILDKLGRDRYLPGFGRPVISRDERIEPFKNEMRKLGFNRGEFVALIHRIEHFLTQKRYRIKPNIAIYGSALFADIGFTPFESYLLVVQTFSAGFYPCYIDSREKSEGAFFPMDCEIIQYSGQSKRPYKK